MKTEQKNPMISIIVPVYNVEPYLEKCLDSITAQTYPNLEVIVVNDASSDRGGQICEAYSARDSRIQAVHFPVNRGVSAARNEGVCRAKGKYMTFIDADDYVEPDLLERLYVNLVKNKADISVCGIDGGGQKDGPARTYSSKETVYCMARRVPFLWNVWGKLYLTEAVKSCPFDEQVFCGEDLLFFYRILKAAKRVSYFPEPLYHYVYRPGSLINSGIGEKSRTVLSVLDNICKDAAANFREASPGFELLALDTAVRFALQTVENGVKEGSVSAWLKYFQKHVRRHFSWKSAALARNVKTVTAVFLLCTSTSVFQGMGAVYKCCKRLLGAGYC